MIHLRPFRRNDVSKIVTWTNDEESFYKWSAGRLGAYPVTETRMLEATSGREDNDKYFPFTAFDENGPIGFFTIRILGEENENARFGYVILAPESRGRGYGKQMLKLGCKFAFELYGAKTVSLGVFENNPSAYYCYKSLGFRETGEIEKYTINGSEWNCIEMELQ